MAKNEYEQYAKDNPIQKLADDRATRLTGDVQEYEQYAKQNPINRFEDVQFGQEVGWKQRRQAEAAQAGAQVQQDFQQKRLSQDFEALRKQTPEAVQDWELIGQYVYELDNMANKQDDQELKQLADSILSSYGGYLEPHLRTLAGDEWYDGRVSKIEEPELGFLEKAGQVLGNFGDYIQQLEQGVTGGVIGGLQAAADTSDEVSAGEGLRHAGKGLLQAIDFTSMIPKTDGILDNVLEAMGKEWDPGVIETSAGKLSMDRNDDGTIDIFEAMGKESASGWVETPIAILASILFDPITYMPIVGQTKALAQLGFKSAASVAPRYAATVTAKHLGKEITPELVEEIAKRSARQGFKNLPDADKDLIRNLVEYAGKEAEGIKTKALFTRTAKDAQTDAMRAIEKDQAGLRWFGLQVPGSRTAANVAGDALRGAGVLSDETFETVRDWVPAPGQRNTKGKFASIPKGVDFDETTGLIRGADGEVLKGLDGAAYRMVPGSERLIKKTNPSLAKRALAATPLADLSPRSRLAKWGTATQDAIGEMFSRYRARIELSSDDVAKILGTDRGDFTPRALGGDIGLWRKAQKDLGGEAGYLKRMNDILTSRKELKRVLAGETDDSENVRKLVQAAHRQRQEAYDELRVLGWSETDLKMPARELERLAKREGFDASDYIPLEEWLPRRLSQAALRDKGEMQKLANLAGRGGENLGIKLEYEGGDLGEFLASLASSQGKEPLIARNVAEGLGDAIPDVMHLQNANDAMAALLRKENINIEKLYLEDPIAAIAAMRNEAAKATAQEELLRGMTKLVDDNGTPLALFVDASEIGTKHELLQLGPDEVAYNMLKAKGGKSIDYRPVHKPDGSVFLVHNDVAAEMENLRIMFSDPKFKNALGRIYDAANNVWAAFATVVGINVAFTARNAVGNLFNMAIKGFRNVDELRHASRNQRQITSITDLMRKEGISFDDAGRRLVKDGKIPQADLNLINLARTHGILNQGRSIDILADRTTLTSIHTGADGAPNRRLNPLLPEGFLAHPGAELGMMAENNARIAFFRDQLAKGASPEIAAKEVKKTLFDYGDLTRFESDSLRRVSRFYTFTRKNLSLQASVLVRRPAAIRNAEKSVDAFLSLLGGDPDEDGPSFVPPWMENPITRSLHFGGGNVALDYDTPWASAQETLQILFDPAWGEDDPVKQMQRDSYIQGLVERVNTLFSGVGVSVAESWMEIRSEEDLFSGRDFSRSTDMRDSEWFRMTAALLPAMTRFESIAAKRGITRGGKREEELSITLANLLLGVQAYAMQESGDNTARFVLQQELLELMQRTGGRESVDELRKAGELRMKDVVTDILMYGWRKDENGDLVWDDAVVDDRLLAFVGADVRKAFGLPEPTNTRGVDKGGRPEVAEGSQEDREQQLYDFEQRLAALEAWRGTPLTEEEAWIFMTAMSGALSHTELQEQGAEGYKANSLAPRTQEDLEAAHQFKMQVFEDRMAVRGWTWDTVIERYPRISDRQRDINNARELGWSDTRIREAFWLAEDEGGLGWLSRNDRAYISQFRTGDRNGLGWITESRYPMLSDQDLAKIQTRAWEAAEELKVLYAFEGWGSPSERELEDYVFMSLTSAERKLLGIDTGLRGAPRREDVRPDAVKLEQAQAEAEALRQGIISPYMGSTRYGWDESN